MFILMVTTDRCLSLDVDLPIEVDDEYWLNDDPALAFKQPEGKPSVVVLFNCILRLGRTHGKMLRTIVCELPASVVHNLRYCHSTLIDPLRYAPIPSTPKRWYPSLTPS